MEEQELLRRMGRGDTAALEEAMDRHMAFACGLAGSVLRGYPRDAEEVVSVLPPPQPASMPTHRAADSIRARVLFFMSFNLQSCNGFVSPWNAIQYIGRL